MINLTLPDGSVRSFDAPVSGDDVAAAIGPGLAKAALAMVVDERLVDLKTVLEADAAIRFITAKDDDGLALLRHDAAHVLAEAVQELYPGTQVTIGPVIENGFYYDFARETPFTPEDLEAIEARMQEIVDRDEAITREVWNRDDAVRFFLGKGETYKAEIIRDLPETEVISLYRQGNFIDLCRGPHLPSTGKLGKAFKLTKVSGAYWRGDHRNAQLQRIYGTCWPDPKQLRAYLTMLEEAEKRDHRRLGREMDLFHFQEEAPGAVFWHPKGWALFQTLIDYMRQCQNRAGYREVNTPELMDSGLWQASGHMEKFGENMYLTKMPDERTYAIKPMNCPGHVQIFKQGLTSYRDLPLKLAEFGKVHRYEPSGALHGLMRVRAFTQDDAHVFCTEAQITQECVKVTDLILSIYRDFGFADVRVKFSDRPAKRVGADAVWDKAEAALKAAAESAGLEMTHNPGEGAFYGPKLEFVLRDAIGRDWQCGTVQVDLNMPERLGATYIGEDGAKHYPVMIHRAMFGSLERFTGILLEHHAGRLPLWLSPTQVMVASIVTDANDYAVQVREALRAAGLRAEADLRNEKINYKIREHAHAKIPVIAVVGQREAAEATVALRRLGGKEQEILALHDAVVTLCAEAAWPTSVGSSAADVAAASAA